MLELRADLNVLKADADVLKADPRCDHRFSVVVDLQQPVISHRVVKPDEESAIDDGISGAVYASYIERERARQERVRSLSGSGGMVYVIGSR